MGGSVQWGSSVGTAVPPGTAVWPGLHRVDRWDAPVGIAGFVGQPDLGLTEDGSPSSLKESSAAPGCGGGLLESGESDTVGTAARGALAGRFGTDDADPIGGRSGRFRTRAPERSVRVTSSSRRSGTSSTSVVSSRRPGRARPGQASDLEELLLLVGQQLVDGGHVVMGDPVEVLLHPLELVAGESALLLHGVELVAGGPAGVPHRDPPVLGLLP